MGNVTDCTGLRDEFVKWYVETSKSCGEMPRFRVDHWIQDAWCAFIRGARGLCFFTSQDGEIINVPVPQYLLSIRDMSLV